MADHLDLMADHLDLRLWCFSGVSRAPSQHHLNIITNHVPPPFSHPLCLVSLLCLGGKSADTPSFPSPNSLQTILPPLLTSETQETQKKSLLVSVLSTHQPVKTQRHSRDTKRHKRHKLFGVAALI